MLPSTRLTATQDFHQYSLRLLRAQGASLRITASVRKSTKTQTLKKVDASAHPLPEPVEGGFLIRKKNSLETGPWRMLPSTRLPAAQGASLRGAVLLQKPRLGKAQESYLFAYHRGLSAELSKAGQ
jgi:hypothetical protein